MTATDIPTVRHDLDVPQRACESIRLIEPLLGDLRLTLAARGRYRCLV